MDRYFDKEHFDMVPDQQRLTEASAELVAVAIDSNLDQVAIQAPPNAGTLNATGKLGVDATGPIGFDIYSDVRDGSTERVQGFAALTTSTGSRFYEVNLFTGSADRVGRFYPHVVDIAIPLPQR